MSQISNLVDSCSFGGRICWVNLGWVGLVGCMLLEGAMYQQTRKKHGHFAGCHVCSLCVFNLFMLRGPMFAWFWLRAGIDTQRTCNRLDHPAGHVRDSGWLQDKKEEKKEKKDIASHIPNYPSIVNMQMIFPENQDFSAMVDYWERHPRRRAVYSKAHWQALLSVGALPYWIFQRVVMWSQMIQPKLFLGVVMWGKHRKHVVFTHGQKNLYYPVLQISTNYPLII